MSYGHISFNEYCPKNHTCMYLTHICKLCYNYDREYISNIIHQIINDKSEISSLIFMSPLA